ncbi:MAG: alanine--glyoxylate aminotransferase family protein [Gemmatimonadetes bacterium]|nr:alanine--glyoxylate aminotransferase family protein [Gemmatimonadota bacterium]
MPRSFASRFFLPGPTAVHPDVLEAMTQPMIGHRGEDLARILAEADPMLRRVFRTERPVYVSSSSATGLMEGAVRNGVRRRALSLVNGAFSGRYRDLVRDCGREVESYEVPWGEAHDADEVRRRLVSGAFDAITLAHSETSTGVLNPLAEIATAVRDAAAATGEEIFLLVDGVTSVGGMHVEMDGWGLDFLLTGSQKALAMPAGLSFGSPSERMLARAASLEGRGQYFDLLEFDAYWKKHQTPTTPAISLIYAMLEQLRRLDAEGSDARAERHLAMAHRCWEWVESRAGTGLEILAGAGHRSPTVTTIKLPSRLRGTDVAARMEQRGWVIGSGYGKLKDTTIRIGHMGEHTVDGLDRLLNELDEVIAG